LLRFSSQPAIMSVKEHIYLEMYIFTVAKAKFKLTRSTRKALRMHIDVAVLVENMRLIFGRAREGNLGSRRIFLSWRATKNS
jgi:hypothetical protein